MTYENTGSSNTSCSLPSSQNTAGLCPRKKNKGSNGKKNPNTIPLCRDETAVCEFERSLFGPSSESIHCSSRTLACSSTSERCEQPQPSDTDGEIAVSNKQHGV